MLWAVNLGCLGFHVWPSQAADPEHADELRIDLDPSPGVDLRHGAGRRPPRCGRLLDELGVVAMPKTTGNRGIHVYVRLQPRWTSYEVRSAAVAVARELERRRPDLITAAWWKEERGTRVFVDFNQNAPHKTDLRGVVGAGPARRPGVDAVRAGTSSTAVQPDDLTIATVPASGRGGRATRGRRWPPSRSRWSRCSALHERDKAAGLLDAPWPPVYPKMPGEPPRVAPSRARKVPEGEA